MESLLRCVCSSSEQSFTTHAYVYVCVCRTSYIIHHTSYITHDTSYIIHHTSYIIHHTSYIIHHTSYIIHHTSYIIHHIISHQKLQEILSGISIIKLFSWEDRAADAVDVIRAQEVKALKKFAYVLAYFMLIILTFTSTFSVVTFVCYSLLGNTLNAEIIFPALVLLGQLTWPIILMPEAFSRGSEFLISVRRLNAFFRREELVSVHQPLGKDGKAGISLKNATFEWIEIPADETDDV